MNEEIIEKLTIWLIFSILLSLLPIVFDAVRTMITGGAFNFDDALARGELALVTAAVCGSAIGELLGVGGPAKLAKILAGGFAVLALLICAFFYTETSAASRAGASIDKPTVRKLSIGLFIMGGIASGFCVALSKVV